MIHFCRYTSKATSQLIHSLTHPSYFWAWRAELFRIDMNETNREKRKKVRAVSVCKQNIGQISVCLMINDLLCRALMLTVFYPHTVNRFFYPSWTDSYFPIILPVNSSINFYLLMIFSACKINHLEWPATYSYKVLFLQSVCQLFKLNIIW